MPAPATTHSLEDRLTLDPQVALRPEPFGALAYHFQTRRLVFLKTRELLHVVNALGPGTTVREALIAAGIDEMNWSAYADALGALANAGVLQPCERAS